MNILTICPCCSSPMLHHFRHGKEYWFCRSCWQEMPNLSVIKEKNSCSQNQIINLSSSLVKLNKAVVV